MAFVREETIAKITHIIQSKLRLPKSAVSLKSSFKDLGADSLDIVDMIMEFEEVFGIQINDDDAEKIKTVEEVANYIHAMRTK